MEEREDSSTVSAFAENHEKQNPVADTLLEEATYEINFDEKCGYRVSCASKKMAFPCGVFQPLATAKWALFLLCVADLAQQTIVNGLYGVNVSTLEERFELRSTESGIIASFNDIGRIVGFIFLIFFPKDLDKPLWMGYGAIVIGIGGILFSLPHFIAPEYIFEHKDILNYCGNVTETDCSQSSVRNFRFVFIVGIALMGIGSAPQWYAFTYFDENVKKRDSALYISIYFAMGALGPAIGFLVGGASLELYTYITMSPGDLTITSSDYSWVGAWWIGFLICGILLLIAAVPILMLPKYLPGTEKHRKNRNVEAQRSHLKNNEETAKSGLHRTLSGIMLLSTNKPYIFMTLGVTLNSALIYGFNTFGAKYLESVFGLTPFQSSVTYGVSAIFASAGAQLFSGFIIKKFNLDVRGMLKFTIFVGIISACCSVGFLVHCDEIDYAGGTVPYPNSNFSISPTSTCNQDCECSTDRYQPVCANGIVYFSPCFAGCQTQINDTTFTNCTCVRIFNSSFTGGIASTDSCDSKSCNKIIPFMFVVCACFFTSVLTLSPALQVTMRCVPFNSRDMATMAQAVFVRVVGVVPGRILVGFVLDFACVSWSTECGEQGSCKSYKRWEIARNNTFLLVAQTIICAIFYILVLLTYKPSGEEGKDGEKEDGQATTKTPRQNFVADFDDIDSPLQFESNL